LARLSRRLERIVMRKLLITTAAAVLVSGAAPAFAQSAQPAQPQQQQTSKPARDPNEIVCERQQEMGSRIATQRVCKTRAEWAEERRSNRMDIDKAQMQRDLSH
jgi:invasion protein IalB